MAETRRTNLGNIDVVEAGKRIQYVRQTLNEDNSVESETVVITPYVVEGVLTMNITGQDRIVIE